MLDRTALLARIESGETVEIGVVTLWKERTQLAVQVFEGVEPDLYPLSEAGLGHVIEVTGIQEDDEVCA